MSKTSNANAMENAKAALAAKRAATQIQCETEPPPGAIVVAPHGMNALQVCEHAASIEKLGETFAASGFFGAVTKSTATAALINCFIEGLSPVEYKAKYHTMDNGTTTVRSDYIQREFRRLGGDWSFNEWSADVCDMTFTYRGKELRGRVTIDEFKANGVAIGNGGKLKTSWAKFPKEMLKARCMATYIRAMCPEALGGMYTQEEAMDFEPRAPRPHVVVSSSPLAPQRAASASAKAAEPEPEMVTPEVVDVVDPTICPCGKSKGRKFEELPNDTLEAILDMVAKRPAAVASVTEAHRAVIIDILREREAEG